MALEKQYNFKGIELPNAYFKICEVKQNYSLHKTSKLNDGTIIENIGRVMINIAIYENESKKNGNILEIIEDVPFEGENNVLDIDVKSKIKTADGFYDKNDRWIEFDKNDIRNLLYTLLKEKYSILKNSKDC